MICEDEIMVATPGILETFTSYASGQDISPLFMRGDALSILEQLPTASIDFCMTSPPYWHKRQYHNGGIGLEKDYREYISDLMAIFVQVTRRPV